MKQILKTNAPADGESIQTTPVPVSQPTKPSGQLLSTADLNIEQVRSTLQLINKMLRKQAQPAELAALLKIKEVREILDLHKVNPKESSEKINQYQKDLAARLRAHDRGKRSVEDAVAPHEDPTVTTSKKSRIEEETPPPQQEVPKPKPRQRLTGILAQAELAVPPTSIPSSQEFDVQWIQYFFQLMCSKIPFFSDTKLLVPGPARTYVEESEDQRVFVEGLSSREIVLLLNFVYDLEKNLKSSTAKGSIIVPSRTKFLTSMGEPLESGLLEAWYFNSQVQCATCALRFANRKLLTIHHDYHYHKYTVGQRRKKGLENNFRGWMETPGEFIGSKEVQFGFHVYEKMDDMMKNNPFLASSGFSVTTQEDGDVDMQGEGDKGPSSRGQIIASHAARTQTMEQELSKNVLPDSVPVDEIKNRCLECGERFESMWIGEPIDMAVFTGAVAIPVGGSTPLQFSWPISAQEEQQMVQNVDDYVDDLADQKRIEQHKVQAVNALADQRFVNSMLFHKSCFESNPHLTTKHAQLDLLTSNVLTDVVSFLRPPPEIIEAPVIEEVSDDEEAEDMITA